MIGEDIIIKEAYKALEGFSWTEEEKSIYDAVVKRDRDSMCIENYALKTAEERGMTKGMAEGMAKGLAEGKNGSIELINLLKIFLRADI
jgi:hypothetical protein